MSKSIDELRQEYEVFASFYEDKDFLDNDGNVRENNSRIFADVIRRGYEEAPVDAYLVMINPGSCKPMKNGNNPEIYSYYKNSNAIEAVSDPAQKCVMLLMDECVKNGAKILNKIRILNLIDYADGNIGNATEIMKSNQALSKSIFSSQRKAMREELMNHDAPIIIAWGLDKTYEKLKEQAYMIIREKKIIGLHVPESGVYAYKYIKPYSVAMQDAVRNELIEQLIK